MTHRLLQPHFFLRALRAQARYACRRATRASALRAHGTHLCELSDNHSSSASGRTCPLRRVAAADGGASTIRASLRSGRVAVNPAGRAGAELALYSACKGGARAAPRWPFPRGRPGRLRRRSGPRISTIQARYGHPRTPRDGFASAGANGAPYSALAGAGVAGCRPVTAFREQLLECRPGKTTQDPDRTRAGPDRTRQDP